MANLNESYFHDKEEARQYLESLRWPDGPVCPHCSNEDKIYELRGKAHRPGLYKCAKCRKQFTVTVGTLFERSHIPLHKWLLAAYLLCSSKKGMSSHQLHRTLGVTYRTAWFMSHRLREGMNDSMFSDMLGGEGKVVEVDETFIGGKKRTPKRGWGHKQKVFSLIERGGRVRSFHVERVNAYTLKSIMKEQIKRDTRIMSDDFAAYTHTDRIFKSHNVVCHSRGEYCRGPIHTNTIEGYFSILKRGLTGIYQHCAPHHLRRYVGEFDFRYNTRQITDIERMDAALKGIGGKRLLYMS